MMMYAIAEALDAGGLPATVWHGTPGLRYDTFDSAAPVFHGLEAELRPGDLLVLAETGGGRSGSSWPPGRRWSCCVRDTPSPTSS